MLREATIDDLDYLTDIQVLAFPSDPQWDYRFPHRKKYPGDIKKYTKLRFESFLKNNRYHVELAEICRTEEGKTMRPVAFAVWDSTVRQRPPLPVAPSTDGDQTRSPSYRRSTGQLLTNARIVNSPHQ